MNSRLRHPRPRPRLPPSNALCAELSLAGVPFTAIGDCRRVGKVLDAMHEAYTAAYNL
ncbi:MAG: hypothetical protein ACLSTO_01920 [Bilophila wadsworthia]